MIRSAHFDYFRQRISSVRLCLLSLLYLRGSQNQVEGLTDQTNCSSHQLATVVDTEIVEFNLTLTHFRVYCSSFDVKPYVRKNLNVRNDVIFVDRLKQLYPHWEPVALCRYSYGNVEMILGQDVPPVLLNPPVCRIRPNIFNYHPITIALGLGVDHCLRHLNFCLFSTCFKAVTQSRSDSKLTDQIWNWYEIMCFAAMKKVHRALLPMLEHQTICKKQYTMTNTDIRSIRCTRMKLGMNKTTLRTWHFSTTGRRH